MRMSTERRNADQLNPTEPLVSIIIPIYNVEHYLNECLDSVVNQTYKNIEIILVNDGSTDGSLEKVKPYLTDSRVILKSQNNQGLSAARNRGLEKASGKYVWFVDSDDYIEQTAVEKLVNRAEEAQADLVRFNADAFEESEANLTALNGYDFSHRLDEKKVYRKEHALKANRRSFSASACLYMVKRTLIEENHLRFPVNLLHEDEWFTTLVFLYAGTLVYCNEAFYHRRYRPNSIMTEKSEEQAKKSFDSYAAIFNELEKELTQKNLSKEQQKSVKRQLLSLYNGMETSEVSSAYKKAHLEKVTSISALDKLYLRLLKKKANIKKI